MTPRNPFDLLMPNARLEKLIANSRRARKAIAKARRKLAQAAKTRKAADIRLLLGMAQVAIAKAEFIARTGTKGNR